MTNQLSRGSESRRRFVVTKDIPEDVANFAEGGVDFDSLQDNGHGVAIPRGHFSQGVQGAVHGGLVSRLLDLLEILNLGAGQLGIYLAESGRADEAVPLLEALAAGERPALDTLNALGIAYARRGDAERALETFERVLALDPDNAMAVENMGAGVLEAARP